MNFILFNMRAKLKFLLLITILLTGCAYWTNVSEKDYGSEGFAPVYSKNQIPAFLTYVGVTVNGTGANPSQDFVQRFISNVRRTRLFKEVEMGTPSDKSKKYVEFSLYVDERKNTHQGEAALKGFFIGLSLYLLTPALPLRYDFESNMRLEAFLWDGKRTQYFANCKGTANFHLFANAALAGGEVQGKVMTNNLNSLMSQLIRDARFYATE